MKRRRVYKALMFLERYGDECFDGEMRQIVREALIVAAALRELIEGPHDDSSRRGIR